MHPLDAQWVVTEKKKTKTQTRVSLEPALVHATVRGPIPKEEVTHRSPLPTENPRAPMSGLYVATFHF